MTIYDRIKYLREKNGLSQQALAEMVGFKTASAVNKIELGLRDINQARVIAFASALGTTPGYLISGEESDEPAAQTQEDPLRSLKYALWGDAADEIPDEKLEEVKRFAQYIKDNY